MRIFITGGGGYIGTTCATLFREQGHTVSCFDRKPASEWLAPLGPGDRHCDINSSLFSAYVREVKPDAVVHLAASKNPVNSSVAYADNVVAAAKVMEDAYEAGTKTFIFASSAAVYGDTPRPCAVREHTPRRPVNLYGRTKVLAEDVLCDLAKAFDIRLTVLRYFNVCGGLCPVNSPAIVPAAVRAAMQGSRLNVADLDHSRDYIHVRNVAQATLNACQMGGVGTFNVGTGTATTLREVLNRVAILCDTKLVLNAAPALDEIQHSQADVSFMEAVSAGFMPLTIDHAIEDAIVAFRRS